MTKKELIIKILEKLRSTRDIADGIIALIQNTQVDEEAIDGLIKIISQSIKTIKGQQEKSTLEKSLKQIHKIHEIEDKQKHSQKDIENILDGIE